MEQGQLYVLNISVLKKKKKNELPAMQNVFNSYEGVPWVENLQPNLVPFLQKHLPTECLSPNQSARCAVLPIVTNISIQECVSHVCHSPEQRGFTQKCVLHMAGDPHF